MSGTQGRELVGVIFGGTEGTVALYVYIYIYAYRQVIPRVATSAWSSLPSFHLRRMLVVGGGPQGLTERKSRGWRNER